MSQRSPPPAWRSKGLTTSGYARIDSPAGPEGAQQQASGCATQRTCSGHALSGSAFPHSSTGGHVALAPTQDLKAITVTSPGKSLGQRSWAAPPSPSQGDAQTASALPHPVTPIRRGAFESRRCLGRVLAEQGAQWPGSAPRGLPVVRQSPSFADSASSNSKGAPRTFQPHV